VGSTELLVDDDVTAFRAQCDLDGVSELVDALLQQVSRFRIEFDDFSHSSNDILAV
jgi:hypothetical protein